MIHLRSIGRGDQQETFGAGFIRKPVGPDFHRQSVDHYALVLILTGSGRYLSDSGKALPLRSGMLFQRRPDILHSNYIDEEEPWFEAFLAIGKQMYRALRTMGILDSDEVIVVDQLPHRKKDQLIRRFYHLAGQVYQIDERNLLRFIAEELETIQELIHREIPFDVFTRYCDLATEEPGRRIQLKEFCAKEGVGYEWFRKRFRSQRGISPTAFAVQARLERARTLLKSTNLPLKKIAEDLGYTTPFEFSAQFRKWVEVSPSEFRRGG